MHFNEAAEPFLLFRACVGHLLSRFNHAAVNAHKSQAPHMGVGDDLKSQGGKRIRVQRAPLDHSSGLAWLGTLIHPHIQGGRHKVHHRVEQQSGSSITQSGPGKNRSQPGGKGATPNRGFQVLDRN